MIGAGDEPTYSLSTNTVYPFPPLLPSSHAGEMEEEEEESAMASAEEQKESELQVSGWPNMAADNRSNQLIILARRITKEICTGVKLELRAIIRF